MRRAWLKLERNARCPVSSRTGSSVAHFATLALTSKGEIMRYLRLVILLSIFGFGFNATTFAQICCPAGCVQDASRCVTIGPNPRSCNTVQCRPGNPPGGGTGGGAPAVIFPRPTCFLLNRTPAARDARTNQCVADLRGRAQLWGCLFEDDAGRAEDLRTGLSCPDRQAALANQCRARCAKFAMWEGSCRSTDQVWQEFFGDIGGDRYGSARIDLCGPRLRSNPRYVSQIRNRPYTRPP
jgi:hypothetical protein